MIITKFRNGFQLARIAALRVLRKIRKKTIIHVFGDSHSLLFKDPGFQIHYLGSSTAYRLGATDSTTRGREKILSVFDKLSPKAQHKALFVFGEIDCRVQIYKASVTKGKKLIDVIHETVDNYLAFVKELGRKYHNIDVSIFNAFPQGEQGNYYRVAHYAKRDRRMKITKMFNKYLKQKCQENRIKFVDVFDQLIDKKERRIRKYIFDDVHFDTSILPIVLRSLRQQGILTE